MCDPSKLASILRRLIYMLAMGLALPVSAWAGSEISSQVVAGDDLRDWLILEQRALVGADAIAAYRQFVLTYQDSTLVETAWSRLVDLGATEVDAVDGPAARNLFTRVRTQWAAHQAVLKRALDADRLVHDDAGPQRTDSITHSNLPRG